MYKNQHDIKVGFSCLIFLLWCIIYSHVCVFWLGASWFWLDFDAFPCSFYICLFYFGHTWVDVLNNETPHFLTIKLMYSWFIRYVSFWMPTVIWVFFSIKFSKLPENRFFNLMSRHPCIVELSPPTTNSF